MFNRKFQHWLISILWMMYCQGKPVMHIAISSECFFMYTYQVWQYYHLGHENGFPNFIYPFLGVCRIQAKTFKSLLFTFSRYFLISLCADLFTSLQRKHLDKNSFCYWCMGFRLSKLFGLQLVMSPKKILMLLG